MKTKFGIYLILIVFFAGLLQVQAQDGLIRIGESKKKESTESTFLFGVKAGVNLSNVSDGVDGKKMKSGLNLGFTVDHMLQESLYLFYGLEFSGKGVKGNSNTKISLSYLQIPFHIGYKFTVNDKMRILLHAGPYMAYAVDGDLEYLNDSYNPFKEYDQWKKALKRIDMGIGIGAGIDISKFHIGLGYEFGMTNISEDLHAFLGENGNETKVKNRNFSIVVGYKF